MKDKPKGYTEIELNIGKAFVKGDHMILDKDASEELESRTIRIDLSDMSNSIDGNLVSHGMPGKVDMDGKIYHTTISNEEYRKIMDGYQWEFSIDNKVTTKPEDYLSPHLEQYFKKVTLKEVY